MMMKNKGFTLVELVIVVAIVGILAAIAIPAYQNDMQRSRRSDGQVALMNMAAQMERYYTMNNTYSGASTPAIIGIPTASPSGYYNLSVTNLTPSSFTLNAAPIAGGAQANDPCGTLTLTSLNVKGPTVAGTTCWQ